MDKAGCGLTLALLVAIAGLRVVQAGAYIEVRFDTYQASCLDDWGLSYCDPKFTFCLDQPRSDLSQITPCFYSSIGESGYFQDTNYVDFSSLTTIKGISNPWIVHAPTLASQSVVLVVMIRDEDPVFHDVLLMWGTTVTPTVHASKSEATWTSAEINRDSYRISFEIRVYCEANYYGALCSKYCLTTDQSSGHYTCQAGTGNKICNRGWTGDNCNVDIDECSQQLCNRGICQNTPGDYVCTCPSGDSGKNCEIRGDPCVSQPCSNGATCTKNANGGFSCGCPQGWEGTLCDVRANPCNSAPCQNGMECAPSYDGRDYTCNCTYPTTGINCEFTVPASEILTSTTARTTVLTTGGQVETKIPEMANMTTPVRADPTLPPQTETVTEDHHHRENSETEGGFKYWYAIIIALAGLLVVAAIILVICLLMRRRKTKENAQRLAYENNAYNDVAEANMLYAGKQAQFGSMIDEKRPPLKLMIDAPGNGNISTDENGNENKSKYRDKNELTNIANRLSASDRAGENIYAYLGGTKTSPVENIPPVENTPPVEQADNEVHYYDLDEVAEAVKRAGNTDHENESQI